MTSPKTNHGRLPYYARRPGAWLHMRPLVGIFIIGLTLTLAGGLTAMLCLGSDHANGDALVCGLTFVVVLLLGELKLLTGARTRQR